MISYYLNNILRCIRPRTCNTVLSWSRSEAQTLPN